MAVDGPLQPFDDSDQRVCLRLYKSVTKIQRRANPHGCQGCVCDFNDLFTTLIGQNNFVRNRATHSTVTDFARFLGLCDRITSLREVSAPQTPQRPPCAVPVIQQSHSLQDCGVCQHRSPVRRLCDRPAAEAAPHAATGLTARNALAYE